MKPNLQDALGPVTFWTLCPSCDVQFKYLWKYVNKKLTCKNCGAIFLAAETGAPSASYPYHPYHHAPDTGRHGFNENNMDLNRHIKKRGRPTKKLKVDMHCTTQNDGGNIASKTEPVKIFDARKLLIDKARIVIHKRLEEMRSADKTEKTHSEVGFPGEASSQATVLAGLGRRPERLALSGQITVPDSDFHDFDRSRTEECFKPKQIWALYDDEDGMPRLYCLIHQVISVKPFKVSISYLSSKTDNEFGSVNWLNSGFTKSCGSFRALNKYTIEKVNIFSHHLTREKAGRGGCVRIYPKRGDIWAVYRNWSSDWNRNTPDNLRHQYEMVEVLDDYSEELGVRIAPLVKLDGFKTVYQRNTNSNAIRTVPRREMVRFSHQVPSFSLEGNATNLPDGCLDLDPAAIPEELLQIVTESQVEKPHELRNRAEALADIFQPEVEVLVGEKQYFEDNVNASPAEFLEKLNEVQLEITPSKKEIKTPAEVLQDLSDAELEKPYPHEGGPATPMELLHPAGGEQVQKNDFIQAENVAAPPGVPAGGLFQGISETHHEMESFDADSC